MRYGNSVGKIAALLALGAVLTGLLTACPGGVVVGAIDIEVDASDTQRCDDGIKAVLEIEDGAIIDAAYNSGPTPYIYGMGSYWFWVKPGKIYQIPWQTTRAFDNNAANETFKVKAYCMRTQGEPGLSEREFNAGDFVTEAGVVLAPIIIEDAGTDPSYTVSPPGVLIEIQQ